MLPHRYAAGRMLPSARERVRPIQQTSPGWLLGVLRRTDTGHDVRRVPPMMSDKNGSPTSEELSDAAPCGSFRSATKRRESDCQDGRLPGSAVEGESPVPRGPARLRAKSDRGGPGIQDNGPDEVETTSGLRSRRLASESGPTHQSGRLQSRCRPAHRGPDRGRRPDTPGRSSGAGRSAADPAARIGKRWVERANGLRPIAGPSQS
jgi:hypothetical protein